jgi:hypothetical protein
MDSKRLAVSTIISAALALPLGGFVFGFMNCEDCGANVFGRALVGLIFAFLTPVTGGFPPRNEGGVGDPFNAWPHIVATWILLTAFLVSRARRKRPKPADSPQPDDRSSP